MPRSITTSLRIRAVKVAPEIIQPPCGHVARTVKGVMCQGARVECALKPGEESTCWTGPQASNKARAILAWNLGMRGAKS